MVKCLLVEYGTFDGVVVVWNLVGLNYWHLRKIKIFYKNQIIRLLNLIQDNAPLRIKECHILNSGAVTLYAYAKVKYILNKEFRKKIHFHRPKSAEIFKFVPKDIMPMDFEGGCGLSHSEQSETTLELMKSLRDRYMPGDILSSDDKDQDENQDEDDDEEVPLIV
ncbi:uncharacterized protein LOC126841505 [Adelges cooleyi]|uniref:uncharacterized protein LOC126841505 n=1 Tax=Adelges cooleyi TaxID=133065 RepID=UPI00217F7CC6|nr:uncharacterized protein LOC126841505 [Adelges cooleyi]